MEKWEAIFCILYEVLLVAKGSSLEKVKYDRGIY